MEINGIEYEEIPRNQVVSKTGRMALMLAGFAAMGYMGSSAKSQDILKGIDIVKEFELIQQKKSKQTKRVRDAVIYAFNKSFRPVPIY